MNETSPRFSEIFFEVYEALPRQVRDFIGSPPGFARAVLTALRRGTQRVISKFGAKGAHAGRLTAGAW